MIDRPADVSNPELRLSNVAASPSGLQAKLGCDEICRVSTVTAIRVGGTRAAGSRSRASSPRVLQAGVRVPLKARLSRRARRRARQALAKGKRVRIVVRITAEDIVGNRKTVKRRARLRARGKRH